MHEEGPCHLPVAPCVGSGMLHMIVADLDCERMMCAEDLANEMKRVSANDVFILSLSASSQLAPGKVGKNKS